MAKMRNKILFVISGIVIVLSPLYAIDPPAAKNIISENASGESIQYLGKKLTAAEFARMKRIEADHFKSDLKDIYKINFKVVYSKYFLVAGDCTLSELTGIKDSLIMFFNSTYPMYFANEPQTPFKVVYFQSKKTFTHFTGNDSYGEYHPNIKTLITYIGSGYGTLWHEMIHAFVDINSTGDLPQWFSEGFASFYEMGMQRGGRHIEGFANWRLPILQEAISRGEYIPLAQFLNADEFPDRSLGYAEGRYLFCYLWRKNLMVSFVRVYLNDIAPRYTGAKRNEMTIKKLEELTGKKISDIDHEYVAMARSLSKNEKLIQKN